MTETAQNPSDADDAKAPQADPGLDAQAASGVFLDDAMKAVRTALDKENLAPETRLRLMVGLEDALRPVEAHEAKERARQGWQIKFLRVFFGISVALTAVFWWRLTSVDDRALAGAYGIFLDRMKLQAQVGIRGMDVVLDQIVRWGKEVEADKLATEMDRRVRLDNLVTVGNWIRAQRGQYQDTYERVRKIEVPKKISSGTFIEDPWTGQKLLLNQTVGGKLDDSMVNQFIQSDKGILMMLAGARYSSQPGRQPLGKDPNAWKFKIDDQLLASFGIDPKRFKGAVVEKPGSTNPVAGQTAAPVKQ